MSEKITYGIENVHYAQKIEAADGTPSYGVTKRWAGASELSMPPVGEASNVYADNVVYYKLRSNQGYEGNLTVYQIPEDFKINHLGEYKDSNGVLVEKTTVVPLDFALLGEFRIGDDDAAVSSGKRFAFYNCSAGRPDFASSTTQDKVEATAMEVPITAAPTVSDSIVKATVKKEDNETLYNSWFESVYYNPSYLALFTVAVTVTSGGSPVAGATVVIGGKVGITNSSGIARIALSTGIYDIAVTANNYVSKLGSVTVSTQNTSAAIILEAA